ERTGNALASRAATVCARCGDDPALATAALASRHVDELAEDAALYTPDFAEAFAGRAALRLSAGLGPQAFAAGAQLRAVHGDLLLRAERGLLERQVDGDLEVGASCRCAAARLTG